MIDACSVEVCYPHTEPALHGVTCSVPDAKLTAVIGPNGCGKSTLLKALCGMLPLQGGTVTLNGRPLAEYKRRDRAQLVSYVAQNRMVSACTVEHFVLQARYAYTRLLHGYAASDYREVRGALETAELTALAKRPLASLSGGQLQKVYLAASLAQNTPLLLLDEPLSFLDIRQQLDFMAQLKQLCAGGKTVCMVVHDLDLALTAAEHIIVMSGGKVIMEGSAGEIIRTDAIARAFSVKTEKISAENGAAHYLFTR